MTFYKICHFDQSAASCQWLAHSGCNFYCSYQSYQMAQNSWCSLVLFILRTKNPVNIYLPQVKNRNIKKKFKPFSSVSIVDFEVVYVCCLLPWNINTNERAPQNSKSISKTFTIAFIATFWSSHFWTQRVQFPQA